MVIYELNFPVRCPVDVPSGKIDESPGREISRENFRESEKIYGTESDRQWELKISREISRPN